MPFQRVIANLTALFVLLPTTIFAGLGSWMFFSLFYAAARGAPYVSLPASLLGAITALLGCIGVITLWVLYFRLCRTDVPWRPGWLHWAGLATGIIALSLLMFAVMVETPWPNRLVFAWPLLAVVIFGAMFHRRHNAA